MGVKDLWKILKPTARPISPEALKGMILGVGNTLKEEIQYNLFDHHSPSWYNFLLQLSFAL